MRRHFREVGNPERRIEGMERRERLFVDDYFDNLSEIAILDDDIIDLPEIANLDGDDIIDLPEIADLDD